MQRADTVAFSLGPAATAADLDAAVGRVTAAAGEHADRIELAQRLLAVGDELPPWAARAAGVDGATTRSRGALGWLPGTVDDVAAALRRRRYRWEISYVTVPGACAAWFAPVVGELAGR